MVETYDITRDALRGLRFLPDFSPFGSRGDWLLVELVTNSETFSNTPFIAARVRTHADALSAYMWRIAKDQHLIWRIAKDQNLCVSGIDADYEIWHVVPSDDEVLDALRQLRLAAEVI